MRTLRSAALLLLLAGPALAAGPPPVITGVYPSPLVSITRGSMYAIEIVGRNFWPSGPNDPSRRVLSARRQGQTFQTLGIVSMDNTSMSVQFPSSPLLSAAGTLEFMVKIDGMNSNIFAVKVVADGPKLDSISPAKITLGGAADDPRWKVWLRGSRWIPDTSIWVNGANVGNCYQNLNSGQEQFTWPPSLRKAGKYSVVLRTEHGPSETRSVEIVAPPTPTPPMAVKKNPLGGTAGTILKATPTAASVILKDRPGSAAKAILRPTPTPTPDYARLRNP